eukprot:s880_g16.t1
MPICAFLRRTRGFSVPWLAQWKLTASEDKEHKKLPLSGRHIRVEEYGFIRLSIPEILNEISNLSWASFKVFNSSTPELLDKHKEAYFNVSHPDRIPIIDNIRKNGDLPLDARSYNWGPPELAPDDPYLCAPRSRGGVFHITAATVPSSEAGIWPYNILCWFGLAFLEQAAQGHLGHWHCFKMEFKIVYDKYKTFDKKEVVDSKHHAEGSLKLKIKGHAGFAFLIRSERDYIPRFHYRELIIACLGALVVLNSPRWFCQMLAERIVSARHVYRRAFHRRFTLEHEIVAWIIRSITAIRVFDRLRGQHPGIEPGDFKESLDRIMDKNQEQVVQRLSDGLFEIHRAKTRAPRIPLKSWANMYHETEVITSDQLEEWGDADEDSLNMMFAAAVTQIGPSMSFYEENDREMDEQTSSGTEDGTTKAFLC